MEFCCPHHPRYYDLLRLLAGHHFGFRRYALYRPLCGLQLHSHARSPLLHPLLSQHSDPLTPEDSSGLLTQISLPLFVENYQRRVHAVLRPFRGLHRFMSGSASSFSLSGKVIDAAGFTSCYGLLV